jgi:uncharacterized protein (DUF4415 family)
MSAKSTKDTKLVRYDSIDDLPPAPPLSASVKAMSDAEVMQRAHRDPDAGPVPADFWDKAQIVEPEGTEQITLRLPRRVLSHFRSGGKGYQSRISAVLASYVDAKKTKKVG